MVHLLLLVISSTFVALPPTIESNNVDLTLSASDGAIAVVSSAGQIEDLVNVLKDMQGQLANCVKTSTGAGKVEDDSSTVTVPIGIFISGNGNTANVDFTIDGCGSTGTMALKIQMNEGRVTSTSTSFGSAAKLSSIAGLSIESSGAGSSIWLTLDASEVCSGTADNFKGASWSFAAASSSGGSVTSLAKALPQSSAKDVQVLELALWTDVEAEARASEVDILEVKEIARDAVDKAINLQESIDTASTSAADNTEEIVLVSDKIVKLSEDVADLSDHALAECTPTKVENAKLSRNGNVLAGTHVAYTCNDGTFNSKGDKSAVVDFFCPGGGGDMTGGVLPQCDECSSSCSKCAGTADTCLECANDGEVPASNGIGCTHELGTESSPAKSCKEILVAYKKESLEPRSGVYYLDGGDDSAYQAYCDMTTDGGGWEVVWKQGGGPNNPNTGKIVSLRAMRGGGSRSEFVEPPAVRKPDTHGSGMSRAYDSIIKAKKLELLRVATVWNTADKSEKYTQLIRFNLGEATTLANMYDKQPRATGNNNEACVSLPNAIKIYYSSAMDTATAEIGKANAILQFAPSTTDSYGLPHLEQNGADTCGDKEWAKETDKLGRAYRREDGTDNGHNTLRHLLGYDEQHTATTNSIRCSACCWSRTNCKGVYETHHYLVRPQN